MTATASPVFDHLVYGWAPTGREGRNRFQVVACSEGFAKSLDGQGRLAVLAQQLCYLNHRHDPGAVSLGWVPSPIGLFLFRREPTGPDSWGRSGGFCANVLHCGSAVGIADAMALLRSDVWLDLPVAVDAGPDLPRVHPVEPPPLADEPPVHLPDFLQAALRSFDDQQPIRLSMAWTDVLDTIAHAAAALPVAPFLHRGFSTYEANAADADRFGICGVATEAVAANRTTRLIPVGGSSDAVRAGDIGQLTVAGGPRVREAIKFATDAEGNFAAGVYVAVLRVVAGDAGSLDAALVSSLLSRPTAAALAFEQPAALEAIVDVALSDWQRLGSALFGVVGQFTPTLQREAAQTFASRFVDLAATGPRVAPDVFLDLGHAGDQAGTILIAAVAEALVHHPDLVRALPQGTLGLLVTAWPLALFDDPVRSVLRDTAFDRNVIRLVVGGIEEHALVDLMMTSIDRHDAAVAAHLASWVRPGQEHAIGRALGQRPTWEDDLGWLIGAAASTSAAALQTLLDEWATDTSLGALSATTRVHRVRRATPDAALDEILALDRSRSLPIGSRLRRAAARLAAEALPAVVDSRARSARDAPLGHRELRLLQTFASDDDRILRWSESIAHVRSALSGRAVDVRNPLRQVSDRNADLDCRHRFAIDTAIAALVIRRVHSARDADVLVDWFVDRPDVERHLAVEVLVALVWAEIENGTAGVRTERTKHLVAALDDATRRRFRRRLELDRAAVSRLDFLADAITSSRKR